MFNHVWSYGRRQIAGLVVGVVPFEEYLFYGFQAVVTALLCLWLRRRWIEE